MKNEDQMDLTRRERQIMDIIFRLGGATAAEVLENLPDDPSYSSVRTILRIMVEKGYLRYTQDGPRYVYFATLKREKAQRSAIRHLLETFFDNSAEDAVAALIDVSQSRLSKESIDRIAKTIEQARKEGR